MSEKPTNTRTTEMVLAAAVLSVLASLLMWSVGEALTFVASGTFSGDSIASGATLILRMVFHVGQPAAAWPEAHPAQFAPVTFWLAIAAFCGLVLYAASRSGTGVAKLLKRDAKPKTASWAGKKDLQKLVVPEPTQGRITLGHQGRALIAAEPRQSVIVVGPTQTNKTTSIAVPAILEWQGPVIATSVKTDLLDNTIGERSKRGDVFVYDPAEVVDLHARHSWTPLAQCATFDAAQATAKSLVGAAKQSMGGSNENDFWYQSAETLIAPYLYAANIGGHDIAKVVSWIDRQDEDEAVAILLDGEADGEYDRKPTVAADDERAMETLLGVLGSEMAQRSSVFTTARTVLIAFRDSKVLNTATRSEINADKLLGGGSDTIYLCAPMHEQKRLRPLYSTLITEMLNAVYERYSAQSKPLDPPLLLVLDEAANIAPITELNEYASTAAGVGIQLVTVFQDLAQARERWGSEKAATIFSNHRARIFLPGIGDDHTLDYVAKITGDQEIRQASHTDGRMGSKSTTESTTYRSIAPANVVRELEDLHSILIYGSLPPAKLRLRPWYEDPVLKPMALAKPEVRPELSEIPNGSALDIATGEVVEDPPEDSEDDDE